MGIHRIDLINLTRNIFPYRLRRIQYRKCGMHLSESAYIFNGCKFSSANFEIGDNSYMNKDCTVYNEHSYVCIGSNCAIALEVMFCTADHEIGNERLRAGNPMHRGIIVEDGCWIGARAIILSGVTVRRGCIIAAGAVVTKNCEENGLYAGVPAKRIRDLSSCMDIWQGTMQPLIYNRLPIFH